MRNNPFLRISFIILLILISVAVVFGGYKFTFLDKPYDLSVFKLGLDLKGGVSLVLLADTSKVTSDEIDAAVESSVKVIERRVNFLGVSEPYIVSQNKNGEHRIIVEIPGVEDIDQAVALVGQTSQIKFMTIKADQEWKEENFANFYMNQSLWDDSGISGADLKGADVVFSKGDISNANTPEIQLKFTEEGRRKFSEIAKNNINKPIGIFLNDEPFPVSMPIVDPDLANGLIYDPVIRGDFDVKQAQNLSIQLRAGALPLPVSIIEQKNIGATLGDESVNKSLFAGIVGFLLVILFMIYMYGPLGILSAISLTIYSLLVLAIFKFVPVVLTLPGIAGFVLSVGMAADASILIFERIKEERYWGKPINLAVYQGFSRAWNSIRDSNISSLITCLILFEFGTGPIKGFAVTLAIGIFTSLFTSIYVVKTLVEVFEKVFWREKKNV